MIYERSLISEPDLLSEENSRKITVVNSFNDKSEICIIKSPIQWGIS